MSKYDVSIPPTHKITYYMQLLVPGTPDTWATCGPGFVSPAACQLEHDATQAAVAGDPETKLVQYRMIREVTITKRNIVHPLDWGA